MIYIKSISIKVVHSWAWSIREHRLPTSTTWKI